jgi:hypothetical protein
MRLIKKSPRTGALVFLPFILAFGCARAPEPPAPAPAPRPPPNLTAKQEKIVCVTLVNGKPMPNVDPVQLSKKNGEVALWVYCGDKGELNITMKDKNDDPFAGDPDNGRNHVRSSALKPDAREKKDPSYKPYKYTITVTGVPNTVPNDPDIEIME